MPLELSDNKIRLKIKRNETLIYVRLIPCPSNALVLITPLRACTFCSDMGGVHPTQAMKNKDEKLLEIKF